MVKTQTTITLDYELIAELKARGLKLSTVINDLLKAHLNKLESPEELKVKTIEEAKIAIAVKQSQVNELKNRLDKLQQQEDKTFSEVWK